MTYLGLAALFTAAAVMVCAVLWIFVPRSRPHAGAIAGTVAALFLLTAVFDTVMIASGLFHYAPEHLVGVHLGLAPLEDFAYPLAGAVLLPTVWTLLSTRRRARQVLGEERR